MSSSSNPVVVITGGAGGIGRETAKLFVASGATVVLVDVSKERLAAVKAELGADGVLTIVSDLSDHAKCVAALEAAGRPVHALVHLAGLSLPDPDKAEDLSIYDAVLDSNTRTAYLMVRAFSGRHDGTGQAPARVVLTSSLAYRRGGLDRIAYSAAKGAIAAMVRASARKLAPTVHVNGVAPGIILTTMTEKLIEARHDALMQEIPIRRFGHPSEIASVIEFLVGPASSYVNGQIINIDGGTVHS